MTKWFRAKEYFSYLTAARGIHSIHSPFLFQFMREVMHDHRIFYCYEEIENLRNKLLQSDEELELTDHGAGSHVINSARRKIRSIAKYSATPKKYAQLLFRMAAYFGSKNILECGTSLGLTTLYLTATGNHLKVVTIEGDPVLAQLAKKHFELRGKNNIVLLQGDFKDQLPEALRQLQLVDLVYLDGNHREKETGSYFDIILPFTGNDSVIVIGDIHWSPGMKAAWNKIILLPEVTLSLDLFFLGIIFLRKELSKQHFTLRF
jgi:predicted O-methyltransferase YrrM